MNPDLLDHDKIIMANARLKVATHVSNFLFRQWSVALDEYSIALRELDEMERVIVFEADELDCISQQFNKQLDLSLIHI